ncbi:MAG: hypothetical protein WD061_01410 [Candidatus Saccharimonadales bacterium]
MALEESHNTSAIVIGVLTFTTVAFLGLSIWAIYNYHQERTTINEQIDEAVAEARADQTEIERAQFEEELQNPYRTYSAPSVFGDINLEVPKNWNIYSEDDTSGSVQIDLYIHPDMVRNNSRDTNDPYAFRMELRDELYNTSIRGFQRDVDRGDLRSNTVEVSGVEGLRFEGQITRDQTGHLVALPFRDKTIWMWTEGSKYMDQFDKILELAELGR